MSITINFSTLSPSVCIKTLAKIPYQFLRNLSSLFTVTKPFEEVYLKIKKAATFFPLEIYATLKTVDALNARLLASLQYSLH